MKGRDGRCCCFIGVAGGTASGKSEFSSRMKRLSPLGHITVVPVDSYYWPQDHLSLDERARQNYDHPDSLEIPLLLRHLHELAEGRSVEGPCYDYAHHTRSSETMLLEPTQFVLVEGILAFHFQNLRDYFDFKVFIQCSSDLRLERRMERDIRERGRTKQSVLDQWANTVHPMHEQFCEPSHVHADLVLNGETFDDDDVRAVWDKLMS